MRTTANLSIGTRDLSAEERQSWAGGMDSIGQFSGWPLTRSAGKLALLVALMCLTGVLLAGAAWWSRQMVVASVFLWILAAALGLLSPLVLIRETSAKFRIARLLREGKIESIRCKPLGAVRAEERSGCHCDSCWFLDVGEGVILYVGHCGLSGFPFEDFELLRLPGHRAVLELIPRSEPMKEVREIPYNRLPKFAEREIGRHEDFYLSYGAGFLVYTFPGSLANVQSDLRSFLNSKPRPGDSQWL